MNRAARLMAELSGGKVCKGIIDARPRHVPTAVGIPLRRVYATAWFMAGVVACVGGVFVGGYPNRCNGRLAKYRF